MRCKTNSAVPFCLVVMGFVWGSDAGRPSATALETARVESRHGVPQILVDGRPVRARMFWGAPGTRPLSIGPAGEVLTFEFTPTQDEPRTATLHLRFGQTPGDVFLDDLRVVELESGRAVIPRCDFENGSGAFAEHWTFWPTGAANTVGATAVQPGVGRDGSAGLRVRLTAPPGGRWPDFHIYHHPRLALRRSARYRVELWVRAEPARHLTIAFYRPGQVFTYLGGPPSCFTSQIRLAAGVGVDFVSFPLGLPWPPPGEEADWSAVDAACQAVLDANPRALLLPRLGLDPPSWWRAAHPDDVMAWDANPLGHTGAVVASPAYRRDAAERLAALIAHVEARFGPHVAGYHPCGQNTGEWFYQDTWGPGLQGYAPGDQRAWQAWLRQRYRDDAALRAAWRDPQVTLATAPVPAPAARRAAPAGVFRDPVAERPLLDFAEYLQQMMADCVCHFAATARAATQGRKLVVFFYGYVFEFGAIRNGPYTAGHYALRRVLDSPDIDLLCSPISYFDRGLGESAPAMTAAESVALAGKLWLYEDDTATYLSSGTAPGSRERVTTLQETNHQLVRNTAQCAVRNFGTWWMDLGATGWFDDPRMWAELERLQPLDEALLQQPRPFRPEVAAVLDEPSLLRVAAGGQIVTVPGVYEVRRPLGRMGAPYGQYLLDDVLAGKVSAKLYVFLTPWCLTADQRRQLREATRGRFCLWCSPVAWDSNPGQPHDPLRHPEESDTGHAPTGFLLTPVTPPKAWAEPTPAGRKLGLTQPFGVAQPIRPLLAAADATAEETLATYPDGSVAVALRRSPDGGSLFVGPPGLTSELLRLAARAAGVHLVTQTDCNVYGNGPYLVLHAAQDGPLEIDTGRAEPFLDLLTGASLGRGPKLTLAIKTGETRVLVSQP